MLGAYLIRNPVDKDFASLPKPRSTNLPTAGKIACSIDPIIWSSFKGEML